MKPWLRKAHRWLGLAFSITILMASGSSVIHTVSKHRVFFLTRPRRRVTSESTPG